MIGFLHVHPRPLHRWKTFWLCLLILAFLGWSWARSMRHSDSLRIQSPRINISVNSDLGSLIIDYDKPDSTPRKTPPMPIFHTRPRTVVWLDGVAHPVEAASWFAPPYRLLGLVGGDSTGKMLVLAYWFLILFFLLPSAALLAWRHHRMKRHTTRTIEPPPISPNPPHLLEPRP